MYIPACIAQAAVLTGAAATQYMLLWQGMCTGKFLPYQAGSTEAQQPACPAITLYNQTTQISLKQARRHTLCAQRQQAGMLSNPDRNLTNAINSLANKFQQLFHRAVVKDSWAVLLLTDHFCGLTPEMSTNLISPILNPWAIRGITRAPAGSKMHSTPYHTSSLTAHKPPYRQ
jgi:hypothetical protein